MIFVANCIFLVANTGWLWRAVEGSQGGRRVQDVLRENGAGKFDELIAIHLPGLATNLNAVPHTIFAPPDVAFADWLESTSQIIDQSPTDTDDNDEHIKRVLLSHIVKDRVASADWRQERLLPTLATGLNLRLGVYGKILTVSGVPLARPDLRVQSSVVHRIHDVIHPLPATNILDTAGATNQTRMFHKMVQQLGIQSRFRYDEPITAFIPIDRAFNNLPTDYLFDLESPVISALVQYHLVNGSVDRSGLVEGERLKTHEGSLIFVQRKGKDIILNENCRVTQSLPASNGVLHLTDCLLNPPASPKQMMYQNKGSHGRGGGRLGEI